MAAITDTGVRGFLKWLKTEQPGIYLKAAPVISQRATGAFDDYHGGNWKLQGLGAFDLQDLSFNQSLVASPTIDVSDAADAGSKSTGLTNTIANIVNGISTLYLTKQQADIQKQVVQTQLDRAAMGLPPLPTSLANLGVPQVNVGLQGGTMTALAVGGGLLLLILLTSGRRSGRR